MDKDCIRGGSVKYCSQGVWTWQCWVNRGLDDLNRLLHPYWLKDFLIISSKRRMFVATYSTQWGWRLLARRGSCHWLVGYEPWRPDAHVCSSDRCPSLPCAARCQSFGALISRHSRCYPKGNTGQFNSLQDFGKTRVCNIFPLSCMLILKNCVRHNPMTRLNAADFVQSSHSQAAICWGYL